MIYTYKDELHSFKYTSSSDAGTSWNLGKDAVSVPVNDLCRFPNIDIHVDMGGLIIGEILCRGF